MIRLRIENSYSFILTPISHKKFKEISKELSYFVKGAQFVPAYQNGSWDGRKRLFNEYNYSFPTGFVSKVLEILREEDEVEVHDERIKPVKEFETEWIFPYPLRYYQKEVPNKAIEVQRGTIILGTGGGKTVLAMKIAQQLGVRTLFLVNTKEALYDTLTAARECIKDVKIGQYGAGKKEFGEFITVATMASLTYFYGEKVKKKGIRNSFFDKPFPLVFVDECHHLGADTWQQAVLDLSAFYVFGLTGTGFRMDGASMLLRSVSGKVICDIPANKLQAEGYLVKSIVYFITIDKPEDIDQPMPYPEVYKFGVIRNKYRNKIIADICRKHKEVSKLIVVEEIEHGDILLPLLKKVDPDTVFIRGTTKNRELLKNSFSSGKIKTVIATRIYNESADVPIIEVVVDAAGGKDRKSVV